tara:strand:+ start:576 stop:1229 length:654 start_codon:yes stop_codon:yes gene_type:complete
MYTKIYDIRTKYRVSQPELASRSGVSQSQISKYEKGEIAKPSHDKLIRIAEALNCSVEDITDELDEKIKPAFQSFNSTGAAIFIPHYTEAQQMNKDFSAGDGIVIRPEAAQAQIRKPSFLEYSDKAYAITTYSEAMQPRYNSGDILYVDPTLTAMKGDDAILLFQLDGRFVGIVREVVEMNEMQISVKDVKSNKTVNFSLTELYEVHVIVGSQRRRG